MLQKIANVTPFLIIWYKHNIFSCLILTELTACQKLKSIGKKICCYQHNVSCAFVHMWTWYIWTALKLFVLIATWSNSLGYSVTKGDMLDVCDKNRCISFDEASNDKRNKEQFSIGAPFLREKFSRGIKYNWDWAIRHYRLISHWMITAYTNEELRCKSH